jgi:hypothetical protein
MVQILFANKEINVANIPKITRPIKLANKSDWTNPQTCAPVTSLKIKVMGALISVNSEKTNVKEKKSMNLAHVIFERLIGFDSNNNSVPLSR